MVRGSVWDYLEMLVTFDSTVTLVPGSLSLETPVTVHSCTEW